MSEALSVNVNFDVNDSDAALNWWLSWTFYFRKKALICPQCHKHRQWWLNFGDVEVDVDVTYDVERVQATSASLYTHTQGLCCTTFGKWLRAIFSAAPSFILVASDRHCTMLGFICGAFLAKIFLQQNSISEKYHQSFPQMMFSKECKCFRIYNYVLYLYFTLKSNLI